MLSMLAVCSAGQYGRAVKGTAETVWGAPVTERTEIVLTAVNQDILTEM